MGAVTEGNTMRRILFILVMIMGIAVFGCGEQPEQSGDTTADSGDSGDVAADTDGHGTEAPIDNGDTSEDGEMHAPIGGGIDMESPDLAVGQWIEFGADEMPETVRIAVVGTETNQGDECYWVQFSGEGFVAQILMDPSGLDIAMEGYQEQMDVFFEDPADYIRNNMSDAGGMAQMFGNEESIDMALEFISAIRMIKFDQGGMVMAIDMTGVPEFLAEMMSDPSFQDSFEEGFMQGFNQEQGQEGLDEMIAELDNMEFSFQNTAVEAAGSQLEGMEFSIDHPELKLSIVFSNELPIIPLAYASVYSAEENETHTIQVRGFGFSGAENLMTAEPAQVIPAMMFLQGMTQQMGATPDSRGGGSAGIR